MGDFRLTRIAKLYVEYERRLREANALDFDDLILDTVRLLEEHEDVRSYYQNKFRYVLIDEYQDTNNLQYRLAAALAGKWENICVVGDDDQSIYRFRGATIENILSFEKQYRGAPGSSVWNRTTAPPRIFWRRPTPSSSTIWGARARSCGPAMTPGTRSRSTPP